MPRCKVGGRAHDVGWHALLAQHLLAATPLQRVLQDLNSDDWQPLRPRAGAWAQPCFFSSFLTALSVNESLRRGLFVPFGVGPLLVLCSSLLYWHDPVKESPRRQLDLATVRLGLAVQVLLTMRYCHLVALPRLLFGYLLGAACYAAGRVLTVRGELWAGHTVHCGVHVCDWVSILRLWVMPRSCALCALSANPDVAGSTRTSAGLRKPWQLARATVCEVRR